MRWILSLLVALPLAAKGLIVPCEASPETLHLLESLPPLHDPAIPYEQRIGALRELARRYPQNFFIQRYYQDSFRQKFYLAEEYDRALAMYRRRPSDPLASYLEARLLMMADPRRSRIVFDQLMRENPHFVWPHLDYLEWIALPGRRDIADAEVHWKAFLEVCPAPLDGYIAASLVQDDELLARIAQDLRRAFDRRHSPLDFERLPDLWAVEERAGTPLDRLESEVQRDLERLASAPLWPSPDLPNVYKEATRILGDLTLSDQFLDRVLRDAPHSTLALYLLDDEWTRQNPPPADEAPPGEFELYDEKRAVADREWLAEWPDAVSLLMHERRRLYSRMTGRIRASGLEGDLALLDRLAREIAMSPDATAMWPPWQTQLAAFYVAARVRLDQVPGLLDAGLAQIERQEKYRISPDLTPREMHSRTVSLVDERGLTKQFSEQIRADYLVAIQRLAGAGAEPPAPDKGRP